jgi:hypothetical protein
MRDDEIIAGGTKEEHSFPRHPTRSGRPTRRGRPPHGPFLSSFRDLHKPFLNKLRRPRHGIRVDLGSGKQV